MIRQLRHFNLQILTANTFEYISFMMVIAILQFTTIFLFQSWNVTIFQNDFFFFFHNSYLLLRLFFLIIFYKSFYDLHEHHYDPYLDCGD